MRIIQAQGAIIFQLVLGDFGNNPNGGFRRADAVAKRYRPWPKGFRADSLPWFDSPLVQGASRLRYTDKSSNAATGPYWPKGARNKKNKWGFSQRAN